MEDQPDQSDLLAELERTVLGEERRYTRLEVAERAGVSIERSQRLWRALGFASVPDDAVVFTDGDVEALQVIQNLISLGVVDPAFEASLTRSLGQAFARLAEWQTAVVREAFADPEGGVEAQPQLVQAARGLTPVIEQLQSHIWRRHLVASIGRMLAVAGDDDAATQAVGFADIVSFTSLSRTLDDEALAKLVDHFEGTASEVVAEHSGRVVKTIGDEVMFVADAPGQGADIALALLDLVETDEDFPNVRVGMAFGSVVNQLGDVYGPVVNIAARLTSLARRNTALVDHEFASAVQDEPSYNLKRLRRVSVRGYKRLEPWLLRPGEGG